MENPWKTQVIEFLWAFWELMVLSLRGNLRFTHTVVDKMGYVAIMGCINCENILNIVKIKQVSGALAIIGLPPLLCFLCCDDLR